MFTVRTIATVLCLWASSIEASSNLHALERIVGGANTNINKHPYMASFGHNIQRLICGATILSNKWVLTAGHCIYPFIKDFTVDDFYVIVGATSLSGGGTLHRLNKWIVHPNYNESNLANDIALLKLATPITFSNNVKAVNLPYSPLYCYKDTLASYFAPYAKFTAVGWGRIGTNAPISDNLKAVDLSFIKPSECKKIWGPLYSSDQLCTIQTNKAICDGDSGGAVMYNNVQLGIVSFRSGYGCATQIPDGHTRVCKYLTWILGNLLLG